MPLNPNQFLFCINRHPSTTISPGYLKFYGGFQKVTYEPIKHCDFVEPQGCSWKSPY